MITVTIITETGLIIPQMINEEKKLESLYALMKCKMVQVAYAYKSPIALMLVDEEGLLKNDPRINTLASTLCCTTIHGHVCIIKQEDFE